jgi:hypothetical protein
LTAGRDDCRIIRHDLTGKHKEKTMPIDRSGRLRHCLPLITIVALLAQFHTFAFDVDTSPAPIRWKDLDGVMVPIPPPDDSTLPAGQAVAWLTCSTGEYTIVPIMEDNRDGK